MSAAIDYREGVAEWALENWGRWCRIAKDPGLWFPPVSVYAKEYDAGYPDPERVHRRGPPDHVLASRVEDEMQVLKREGSWGFRRYKCAKMRWVDFNGEATMEEIAEHMERAFGRPFRRRQLQYYLSDVRARVAPLV